ncbi:MAG: UTP--glucose-1-phosphate uridylyltransferase [Pseudomonadota bacterium]
MLNVRKAVIPAAGLGTRFLPITKSLPKELLPIGSKPTLQIVIEELIASGIFDITIITSPHKQALQQYFDINSSYHEILDNSANTPVLDDILQIRAKVDIKWVFQNNPRGLGHAILCAKGAVGLEPFVICLPDVIIESKVPCTKQLIQAYEEIGEAVNATEHTPQHKLHLYGIYDISSSEGKLHKARGVVEKPKASQAPSDLCVVGRYLFPADIFPILEDTKPGYNGEIQLADAMNTLAKAGRMYAYEYEGTQFDTGDKLGFLKANIYFGHLEFGKELGNFLKTL